MSNSRLPEDLLILVLLRLPLKSLGRSKCTSKSWNALISSKEFIKSHLNQSRNDETPSILVCTNVNDHDYHGRIDFPTVEENLELGCKIQWHHIPFKRSGMGLTASIVGSCNGLVCQIICGEYRDVYNEFYWEYCISLCNPLTKSSWGLSKRSADFNDDRRCISFCGFGYDDVNDDYKVMTACGRNYGESLINNLDDVHEYAYEVYSLKSNSWSRVRSYLDFRYHHVQVDRLCALDGVLLNCTLHWILWRKCSNDDGMIQSYILAFDLRTNKQKILHIPEVLKGIGLIFSLRMSVLNGCLVIRDGDWCSSLGLSFDLWVMKEYGLKDSWMKITIPQYDLKSLPPLALVEDNQNRKLIFYDHYKGLILLYDLISHQVMDFPVSGGFRYAKQFQFVGSLVRPHPPTYGYLKTTSRVKNMRL